MSLKLQRAFDVARGRCVPDISTNPPVLGSDCRDPALVRTRNYWQKAMVVSMEVAAGSFSWFGFFWLFGCLEEEVSKGAPDRLVEVSTKRIVAKEFHCKLWTADEGTQIPG